jgi:hypothetical protein
MEKGGSEKRRISATGCFLFPSLKAEWNCVGSSGGHFSKSARNGAPPAVSLDVKKTNALYFAVKVDDPPNFVAKDQTYQRTPSQIP